MANLLEYQASQLLRAANDIAGYLATVSLRLYKASIDINPNNVLADFTGNEADYGGYAAVTLVWDDPSVADDGTVEVVAHSATFRPTGPTPENSIWGFFITDATPNLLFAGQADGAPLPMNNTLDQIVAVVRYRPATQSLVVVIS